ncbi:MAG: hypothetical protein WBQ34_07405, partial [Candidatus Acidiferrales bacterium]
FEAARLALGTTAAKSLDYFETCRRKRNDIDYDHASVATETEAVEMVAAECQGRIRARPAGRSKIRPLLEGGGFGLGFAVWIGRGGWSGDLRPGLPGRV